MENKIICPAIYRHFKGKYYATMGISKPMSINRLREIYNESSESLRGTLYCLHTEEDIRFIIINLNGEWYHEKEKHNEELILYKSLYDDTGVYARPLEMFISEADKNKYSDIKQEFRFELVRY